MIYVYFLVPIINLKGDLLIAFTITQDAAIMKEKNIT